MAYSGTEGATTRRALPRVRGDWRRSPTLPHVQTERIKHPKPRHIGRVHHRTSSRGSMSSCSSLKALPWRPTCTALFFTTLLRFFSCLQHVLHFWCLQEKNQSLGRGTRTDRRRPKTSAPHSPLLPRDVHADGGRRLQRVRDQRPEMPHDELQRCATGLHVAAGTHSLEGSAATKGGTKTSSDLHLSYLLVRSFSIWGRTVVQRSSFHSALQ